MAKEEKKAPKLRFNGYTNDWERKELNNILKINSGRDYKQLNSGNIPVYGTGGYMLSVNDKLSDTDAVGIGRKGTIDKPLYLKAPFWTVDTLFYCTSKENSDVKFIYLLFQIINWKRYDESTGVPSLSKNTISNIKTYVPKIKEQDYISKLFFSLDNTLQLHERKYEELALIKQALLQKLFPKKDEVIPEVRYKSFSAAWEQRKLGGVAKFYSGGTPSVGVSDYYDGTIPFIRSAEINSTSTELYLSELGLQNSSAKMVHRGDILYALYGATSGEVGISKINGAINQAILAIIPHKGYNSEFLEQWLRKNKEAIIKTYLQGGQGNLSGAIVKQIKVSFPSFDEQQKIGKSFQKIDSLITLHQRKLEKLKQLKKFLLQNMFI